MREEQYLNGEYDFDGESKDFRRTLGKVGIILGILFCVLNTYLLSKVIPIVQNGNTFEATIRRKELKVIAEYKEPGGRNHTYDVSDIIMSKNKKTIRMYYTDKINEAFAVNWITYIISYIVYIIIIALGILGMNNMSVKDFIKKISNKKKVQVEANSSAEE